MRRAGIVVSILFFAVARSAVACVCTSPPPKDNFKGARFVLVGEVISYESGSGGIAARVRVIEQFKGPKRDEITVYSEPLAWGCSYGELATAGRIHLLQPWEDELGNLQVGLCGGNWVIESDRLSSDSGLKLIRSRAAWWRSPLSSLRILKWLGYDSFRTRLEDRRRRALDRAQT